MKKNSRIYVAGHTGLVGTAVVTKLKELGFSNVLCYGHKALDLTRQEQVESFFDKERPEYVILAAAKVGGILANSTYKAQFIYDNTMISSHIISASWKYNVKKLINLGSSCIYPKLAPQPIKEESLLTGALESTNEPYAIAKISAIKMCRYFNEQYGTQFLSAMPSNLYGPHDNFDLQTSHVLPAMIKKLHKAKTMKNTHVTFWGDGTPLREFLYAQDLACAIVFMLEHVSSADMLEHINVGTGKDITIKGLAILIKNIVGFEGIITWDTTKPNGTYRKLMDSSKIHTLGWNAQTSLEEGIIRTYTWFCEQEQEESDVECNT